MEAQHSPAQFSFTGYILPNDKMKSNEDNILENEEEKEEELPEFLDMDEMEISSGGHVDTSRVPSSKIVILKVDEEKYQVEGRFHLCDPWWQITCRARKHKYKEQQYFVIGFPSYSLCTDLRTNEWGIVPLFLAACDALPESVAIFTDWVLKNNYDKPVTVMNVTDALDAFGAEEKYKAIATELKSRVHHSDSGHQVLVAALFPNIMKYLPTLLPGKFTAIISGRVMTHTRDNSEVTSKRILENLDRLDKLITTYDVWKLGFHYIMFKEFGLIRCEAKVTVFKQCDLYKNIPKLQQDALLLYEELKKHSRDTGSTYMEQKKLLDKVIFKIGEEGAWRAKKFLEETGVLERDRNKLALQNLFSYEKGIAECLRSLVLGEPWKIKIDVRKVLREAQLERLYAKAASAQNGKEQEDGSQESGLGEHGHPNGSTLFDCDENSEMDFIDEDHVKAAENMCAHPVTVVSGKGGCGKTTVVSLVFKAFMNKLKKNCDGDINPPLEILLTAPTGKAASLLTKKNGFKAYTMHQVIWSFIKSKKQKCGKPKDWLFSKVRVLVVDEGSLVCVQILHSLLSMLTKHAQLQKFIILGDVRQLPSIEPGNTLCDLFNGLKTVHWAIEMRTNHRAESKLIIENAGQIAERNYNLKFDAILDMTNSCSKIPDKSFIFAPITGENYSNEIQDAILFLLKEAPGLKSDRLSQFVTFKKKDCELINELCCKHYSQHITRAHKNKLNFQKNDKVCCTRTGYVLEDEDQQDENKPDEKKTDENKPDENKPDENQKGTDDFGDGADKKKKERLCNGEVFFIKEDLTKQDMGAKNTMRHYITLDDEDGRVVTACFSELQKECKLSHAWARTIHTFQGSEAETVVYVLGESKAQNWQHFYTAVTRGQKRVYVLGTEADIKQAIRNPIIPRNTQLCSFVKERVLSAIIETGMA